jgi:hypothetical protein
VNVIFDARTEAALSFVSRTINHGAPERVALVRAERKFGTDRKYLRALLRFARHEGKP